MHERSFLSNLLYNLKSVKAQVTLTRAMSGAIFGLSVSLTLRYSFSMLLIVSSLASFTCVYLKGLRKLLLLIVVMTLFSSISFALISFLLPKFCINVYWQVSIALIFLLAASPIMRNLNPDSEINRFGRFHENFIELFPSFLSLILALIFYINTHNVPINRLAVFVSYEDNDAWLNVLGILNHGAHSPNFVHSLNFGVLTTTLSFMSILTFGFFHSSPSTHNPQVLLATYELIIIAVPIVVSSFFYSTKSGLENFARYLIYLVLNLFAVGTLIILILNDGTLDGASGALLLILTASIYKNLGSSMDFYRWLLISLTAFGVGMYWAPLLPVSIALVIFLALSEHSSDWFKLSSKQRRTTCFFISAVFLTILIINSLEFFRLGGLNLLTASGGVQSAGFSEKLGCLLFLVIIGSTAIKQKMYTLLKYPYSFLIILVTYFILIGIATYLRSGSLNQYGFIKLEELLVFFCFIACTSFVIDHYGGSAFTTLTALFVFVLGSLGAGPIQVAIEKLWTQPVMSTQDIPWLSTAINAIENNPGKKIFCLSSQGIIPGQLADWNSYFCGRFVAGIQGIEAPEIQSWRGMTLGVMNPKYGVEFVKKSKPNSMVFVFIGSKKDILPSNSWSKPIVNEAILKLDRFYYTR